MRYTLLPYIHIFLPFILHPYHHLFCLSPHPQTVCKNVAKSGILLLPHFTLGFPPVKVIDPKYEVLVRRVKIRYG
jgi:hypothetical protein